MAAAYSYQTYLINLDRAKERLAFMESEFKKQDVVFERIVAVDAKNLDATTYKINNK